MKKNNLHWKCACGIELPLCEGISRCLCGEVYQFVAEWNDKETQRVKSYVEIWIKPIFRTQKEEDEIIEVFFPGFWQKLPNSRWI